ncbi:MAG: hypothetical protein B7X04_03050 [Parcubacteria group bacterium 21-54-25]|nr:MAG: hypothetical protein B7X04_03050 [Parcubacteria group bacterium 21-54-25]HQU07930.1 hypothetical protein [Candidatus Paceibacterota bacterium]
MTPKRHDVVRRPRTVVQHSATQRSVGGRLGMRRRRARLRLFSVLLALGIFLGILVVIGLWQPSVRIEHIAITSGDTGLVPSVQQALTGTYAGIVPRNSIFFFSAASVRDAVLAADPTIAAVSVTRTGLNAIAVTPDSRTPLARWCGVAQTEMPTDTLLQDIAPSTTGSCYLFDSTGFLYASTPAPSIASTSVTFASTTASVQNEAPLVPFPIYAPLIASSSPPLLQTIANANKLPALFDFARQLRTFGTQVVAAVIRGDEVDLFLTSGTRITYVLGNEQGAYALLAAVKDKITLSDGSLIYVDLRFPDKVYFLARNGTLK